MQPNYSEQLKAIVAALNHPTTPAWAIAVLSAILGMIGGISPKRFCSGSMTGTSAAA